MTGLALVVECDFCAWRGTETDANGSVLTPYERHLAQQHGGRQIPEPVRAPQLTLHRKCGRVSYKPGFGCQAGC